MSSQRRAGGRNAIPKPRTIAAYGRRYGQLKRAAPRSHGKLSLASFVDWIIDVKRKSWSAASWRQNRAALRHGLASERAANPALTQQIDRAIARLDATRADPPGDGELRTAAQKSKRFRKDDLSRIRHAALAGSSPNGTALADLLLATTISGLRPEEWRSAVFGRCSLPGFAWQLVVRNAKHDDLRAHGEFRTLHWTDLDEESIGTITRSIALAGGAASDNAFARLSATLQGLMRTLTRKLFPRRRKRPTLYTARHEAIARWKAAYVETQSTAEGRLRGLLIVAALSGHASDETATMHYGRPGPTERGGKGWRIPIADEAEVARVRRRMQYALQRLAELKMKRGGPKI